MTGHMYNNKKPKIAEDAFVSRHAIVIGDVQLGSRSSIWPNAVVRGDVGTVKIGSCSNIQDGAMVHTPEGGEVVVGDCVSIGHGAILHGCKVGNNVLVGMGAIILDRAEVSDHVLIGAGALVPQNVVIPSRSLLIGIPGRITRQVTNEELEYIRRNAEVYVSLASKYAEMAL
ncbi:MAG: gamma carbonic anhydrase family protein [Candidatus Bathyarchaeia archaeon]